MDQRLILLTVTLCFQLSGQETVEMESSNIRSPPHLYENPNNDIIASAVNNFGYKMLIKMMNERKNDNIVMSPTGVAGLLAMALLGSVGRTFDEIADTLGFSQDIFANRKNHEDLGALLRSLNSNFTSKTLYADAMFVDSQTPLRELYRNYLHDVYGSEVLSTDFKKSQVAKDVINEWVKNHTGDKIDMFLKHTLPVSTKVLLLSALYFNGQWREPFRSEYTAKMPFKKLSGEVSADLMLNYGNFPYTISKNNDFIMVGLPYNDSETVMYVIKPLSPAKMNILDLMNKLNQEKIDDAINEMKSRKCVIRFPKMDVESNVNLENALKVLGIRDMFQPDAANFALMVNGENINKSEEVLIAKIGQTREEGSRAIKNMLDALPNPGIYVDSVIHDVKITIDEYGTEAVAATSTVLARTAEQFYADSPFYMFIRNNRTKLVTFSAIIFDPTI